MAKKQQLGYKQIEANLALWKTATPEAAEVGYAILTAFGKSEREIKRFKEGKGILKTFDGLLIKSFVQVMAKQCLPTTCANTRRMRISCKGCIATLLSSIR